MKITFHDISLTKQEMPKGVNVGVSIGNLEMIPIDTLEDDSLVKELIKNTKSQKDRPKVGHQSETKYPQKLQVEDLQQEEYISQGMHQITTKSHQEPHIVEFKQEAPLVKIDSYHRSHHPTRQQLFKIEGGNQQPYGPRWK